MKKILVGLTATGVLGSALMFPASADAAISALIGDRVIDGRSAKALTDVAVLVEDDRITGVVKMDQIPEGSSLRQEALIGKIVRVEGKVAAGSRLKVVLRNDVYDIWSFDSKLRKKLRNDYEKDDTMRFYGELGLYKGRWQFIVRDASWVK